MSRDYRPVRVSIRGRAYFKRCEPWNVNVSAVSYYGHLFNRLGLPTYNCAEALLEHEEAKENPDPEVVEFWRTKVEEERRFPKLSHSYAGKDLARCRAIMRELTERQIWLACEYASDARGYV